MNGRRSKGLRNIAKRIGETDRVSADRGIDYVKAPNQKTIFLNLYNARAVYKKLKEARRRLADKEFDVFVNTVLGRTSND